MKGKEGGTRTRNQGRRNVTKGIDTETTHKQSANAHHPNKH